MEIRYLGHSSFLLKSKNAAVVCDPYVEKITGLKFPKVEADIVTISHDHEDHNASSNVLGKPLVINIPGEYEINGVRVFGFYGFHDRKNGEERGKTYFYKIEIEGIKILHCGDLATIPVAEVIDEIEDVDVMLIPVGGNFTFDAKEAVEFVKKIEPSIVIPMHYNTPELNQEKFGSLLPVTDFLSKMGLSNNEPIERLVLKKEELSTEGTKVVLMKAG